MRVKTDNRLNVTPIIIRSYTKNLKTSCEYCSSFWVESHFVLKVHALLLIMLHSQFDED